MSKIKFPFLVTEDTLKQVMPGNIVIIQFDNPKRQGTCHWLCGNRYKLIVTSTCIPDPKGKYACNNACEHLLCTNSFDSDVTNQSQSEFFLEDKKKNKWSSDHGGDTECTITVIDHLNNLPITELLKKHKPQEFEIIP